MSKEYEDKEFMTFGKEYDSNLEEEGLQAIDEIFKKKSTKRKSKRKRY